MKWTPGCKQIKILSDESFKVLAYCESAGKIIEEKVKICVETQDDAFYIREEVTRGQQIFHRSFELKQVSRKVPFLSRITGYLSPTEDALTTD